jgi:hypothetical protein
MAARLDFSRKRSRDDFCLLGLAVDCGRHRTLATIAPLTDHPLIESPGGPFDRRGSPEITTAFHTETGMPRHIRSVTARRPRKFARPVKDAPPVAAPAAPTAPTALAAPPSEVELFDGLRQAFQPTPEIPETPERTRERYVWAIESLANYLEDIGADAAWVERIEELGWALEDLTTGALPLLLEPTRPKSGRP